MQYYPYQVEVWQKQLFYLRFYANLTNLMSTIHVAIWQCDIQGLILANNENSKKIFAFLG